MQKRTFLKLAAAAIAAPWPSVTAAELGDVAVRRWRVYGRNAAGQLHVHAAAPEGRGTKRPLICFHTSPASGLEFRFFQDMMARDRLVLCPDTPGFGNSDAPASMPDIAVYAALLMEGLDGTGLLRKGQAIDILGTHTGTVLCTELAQRYRTRINRVVLSGVPLFAETARAEMVARFAKPVDALADPTRVPKDFETAMAGPAEVPPARRYEMFVERLKAGSNSWWGPRAALSYDLAGALPKISQPTLFLVVRDTLAPNTRAAAKLVPKFRLIDLEAQTTAAPWDQQSALIAGSVRDFLA